MDTKIRSLVKALVWRAIGIVVLGTISYIVTGSWREMTLITIIFHGIHTVLYYMHERLWERITWGRINR